jgi:hypothetical protein
MKVLTEKEHLIMIGQKEGAPEEVSAAVLKLKIFQRSITDPTHIGKVNAYINDALKWAKETAEETGDCVDHLYHQRMNELTKAAGLRC